MQQRVETHKIDDAFEDEVLQNRMKSKSGSGEENEYQSRKIQQLQEQLMEIRGSHIQELEELKV